MKPPLLDLFTVDDFCGAVRLTGGGVAVRDLLKERPPPRERASASSTMHPIPVRQKTDKRRRTGVNRFKVFSTVSDSFLFFS
jgi:hypothetical protein